MQSEFIARIRLALTLSALLLTCSCGSPANRPAGDAALPAPGVAQRVASPAEFSGLASPRSLIRLGQPAAQRAASYTEGDLTLDGEEFYPALPHNLVSADNPPKLDLAPTWDGSADCTLSDVAYCIYHFQVTDYDRNPQLRVNWSNGPADDQWLLGVSNWQSDRWDWFLGTPDGRIELGDLTPYQDFGSNMLVVLACMGDDPCILYGLRLGGLPPLADLAADVDDGNVPLLVHFDASASQAVEGEIVSYEWDFEGDGSYELNTGTTATATHNYVTNDERWAHVRVTNTNNASDTCSTHIRGVGEWHHSWRAQSGDTVNDLAVDSSGNIYAVGTTYVPDGDFTAILLFSVSPAGQLRWARGWDTAGREQGLQIELAADGTLVIGASYQSTGASDVLLQKWTKQGALQWSRRSGGESTEQLSGLLVDGNDIYVCGSTLSTVAFWDYDYYVFHCAADGINQWARARDNGEAGNQATAMCFESDPLTGVTGLILVGTTEITGGTGAWMVEYDIDATFSRARELGAPPWLARPAGVAYFRNPISMERRYYVAGELLDGERPFIHGSDGAGACQYGTRLLLDQPCTVTSLLKADTGLLLSGSRDTVGGTDGMLWQCATSTGDVLDEFAWVAAAGTATFNALAPTPYGLLLGGSVRDSTGSWHILSGDNNGFSVSWEDAPGNGTSLVWTWDTETSGEVVDLTSLYETNTDEDGQAALLCHRTGL